ALKIQSASSEEDTVVRKGRTFENIKKLNKKGAKLNRNQAKTDDKKADEFVFDQLEVQDAEADYFHKPVNSLKNGQIILIEDKPSKIASKTVSKTGKHGHAKANIMAVEIFSGKKIETSLPSSHSVKCPKMVLKEEMISHETSEMGENGEVIYTVHVVDANMLNNSYAVSKEDFDKLLAAREANGPDRTIMAVTN
ncbi:MAG: Eukaryotic translation initiation factor 5A-2, partial [Marteilia pararefringens]